MSNDFLSKAGRFLLETSREAVTDIVDEKILYERILGIEKTVKAMKEVNVSETLIVAMLQKHWDLRLSEAEWFINESAGRKQNDN